MGAKIQGACIGSDVVTFLPQEICPGNYHFQVGNGKRSAGSVTLLLQTLLPVLCLGEERSRLSLMGGTHVAWSPPFHDMSDVLFPVFSFMRISAEALSPGR
jgi:RNA 3'-terminal phosphate cyclase